MAATVSKTLGGTAPDSRPRRAANWLTKPSARGQGSAEGQGELEDVHGKGVDTEGELARRFQVGIARPDIDDKAFAPRRAEPGKPFNDALHGGGWFRDEREVSSVKLEGTKEG